MASTCPAEAEASGSLFNRAIFIRIEIAWPRFVYTALQQLSAARLTMNARLQRGHVARLTGDLVFCKSKEGSGHISPGHIYTKDRVRRHKKDGGETSRKHGYGIIWVWYLKHGYAGDSYGSGILNMGMLGTSPVSEEKLPFGSARGLRFDPLVDALLVESVLAWEDTKLLTMLVGGQADGAFLGARPCRWWTRMLSITRSITRMSTRIGRARLCSSSGGRAGSLRPLLRVVSLSNHLGGDAETHNLGCLEILHLIETLIP